MATVVWTDSSSNWSTTSDWSTSALPSSGDDVVLPGIIGGYTVTLDIAVTPPLDSLTIGIPGSSGTAALAVGSNSLDINGSGTSATDRLTLTGSGGSVVSIASGGVVLAPGGILLDGGSDIIGAGTIIAPGGISATGGLAGGAAVVASGGRLLLQAGLAPNVSNTAPLYVANAGGDLAIGGPLGAGNAFQFAAPVLGEIEIANDSGGPVETVAGMGVGSGVTSTGPGTADVFDFISSTVVVVSGGAPGSATSDTLVLADPLHSSVITLNLTNVVNGGQTYFVVTSPDGAGGTHVFLSTACYCRGTLIRTETGEVAVETLAIGDRVMTISGEAKPIKWAGRRTYDGRFIAGNTTKLPIRIAAGALAEGIPARDLWVSPEHALFIGGALVPAQLLVNGSTISQVRAVDSVEYFHIELEAHDVMFAEGAPAESYVECDNRAMFQNAGEFSVLYPGDERPSNQFCAPRLAEGTDELAAIRAVLQARAEALEPGLAVAAA